MIRSLAAAFVLLAPTWAAAHAFLDGAQPHVGSQNATAPAQVVLHFTQDIEPAFSMIEVQDSSGRSLAKGRARTQPGDAASLVIDVEPVSAGTYTVIWHATAIDTHKTQGSFHFTVGH